MQSVQPLYFRTNPTVFSETGNILHNKGIALQCNCIALHSSFYFQDHYKCYLFSLVTPVHSVHVWIALFCWFDQIKWWWWWWFRFQSQRRCMFSKQAFSMSFYCMTVLQESVLGPILYVLYTAELHLLVEKHGVKNAPLCWRLSTLSEHTRQSGSRSSQEVV